MTFEMSVASVERMRAFFFEAVGKHLRRPEQRASFATYAFGLMSEGERKSVEPMAARATGNAADCQRMHDRLLHFVGDSPWDDRAVRREAATLAMTAMG